MPSEQMPRDHAQAIGLALKQAREGKGESLAEAAFRIALSPSQLRAIESADVTPFYSASYYRQAVERYASFLGVSLNDIAPEPSSPTDTTEVVTEVITEAVTEATPTETTTSTETTSDTRESSTREVAIETNAPLSLREKLGHAPEEAPSEQPRSRLGWVALIAAVVIALGVIKVAMEKPTVEPTPPTAAPVPDPAQKSNEATTPTTGASGSAAPAPTTPSSTPAPAAPTTTPPVAKPAAAPTTPSTAKPAATPTSTVPARGADSQLESKVTTWVQIVKSNGEKSNLKMEPGQKIEFVSSDTAAVVFGQPDQGSLKVKGRAVNLKPFITQENPSRALVILNQIRE